MFLKQSQWGKKNKKLLSLSCFIALCFFCFILLFHRLTAHTFADFSIPSNRSGSSAPTTAETWLSISRYIARPETAYLRILYVWHFSSKRKVLVFYYLFWLFHHFHSWRMIRKDFVVMALSAQTVVIAKMTGCLVVYTWERIVSGLTGDWLIMLPTGTVQVSPSLSFL